MYPLNRSHCLILEPWQLCCASWQAFYQGGVQAQTQCSIPRPVSFLGPVSLRWKYWFMWLKLKHSAQEAKGQGPKSQRKESSHPRERKCTFKSHEKWSLLGKPLQIYLPNSEATVNTYTQSKQGRTAAMAHLTFLSGFGVEDFPR